MSNIAMQGGATGTGTVTLLAPVTSTDRTLTLPDATDTVAGIAATQTLTNKTLTSPTLTTPNIDSAQFATVSGTAPIYPCRAWVNFNGTGTPAIRASGNVSSITDSATGQYVVNFATALPDANYSTQLTNGYLGSGEDWVFMAEFTGKSTTSVPVRIVNYTVAGYVDSNSVNVAIFR